jgi:2-oxoglutarate ferredoxin oxidoreductase subunit alpha
MKINILVVGKAGDGIDFFSETLCHLVVKSGLYAFNYRDYQSMITGGTNFNVITIANEKVFTCNRPIDIGIFFDSEHLSFLRELKKNAIVICDENTGRLIDKRFRIFPLNIEEIIRKNNLPKIVKNIIFLGALAKILNLGLNRDLFKKNVKENEIAFNEGYKNARTLFKLPKSKRKIFYFNGNQAIAFALKLAKIHAYYAYPMTPSTRLLYELAKTEVFTYQFENEIAVINAALGTSLAGKKVAIGTSGGGFDLMTEALSFSGMAELPIVIYVGMRYGPSTGAPTYSSQADLNALINSGHGDFAKVVLSFDANTVFKQVIDSVRIAYTFRLPVIIAIDKNFVESGFSFDEKEIKKAEEYAKKYLEEEKRKKKLKAKGLIKTYPLDNPFSPLPELGRDIFKINSYEHDEFGFERDDVEILNKMSERRKKRIEEIGKIAKKGYSVYGNENAKVVLIAYGGVANSLIEFVKNKPFKLISLNYLHPLPSLPIKKKDKVYVFDDSITCQLAEIIEKQVKVDGKITKNDGRIWTLEDVEEKLKELNKN